MDVNFQSACSHVLNIGGIRYKRTRAKSSIFQYVVLSLARCWVLYPLTALDSQVRTVDALGFVVCEGSSPRLINLFCDGRFYAIVAECRLCVMLSAPVRLVLLFLLLIGSYVLRVIHSVYYLIVQNYKISRK